MGRALQRGLRGAGHEVAVLSRRPVGDQVFWDGETVGPWASELEGADAVINLAGRSVNCRYHAENRRQILESRVRSVRVIGGALRSVEQPPGVWLQAATATIYAHRYDAANDEATGLIHADGAPETWQFSLGIARAWEEALAGESTPGTRKVALRSAMTMSRDEGSVFDVLSTLVRRGLGGAQGNGRQFVSWIHEVDFTAAILYLISSEMEGTVNVCSPNPLPNREFMRALREAWGVRFGLPVPAPLLEIGAWAMGTETELILKSRLVVPGRLLEAGFAFQFPEWGEAARELAGEGVREFSPEEGGLGPPWG